MTNAQLDKQVATRLAEKGVRYTSGRRAVVAGLEQGEGPMTVGELQESLNDGVPLSSLYRTLALMSDTGIISLHHSAHGLTRYELAEWLAGHHHHLVCITCGSVDDIEISVEDERGLELLVQSLAGKSGFAVTDHSLEIDGECRRCQA